MKKRVLQLALFAAVGFAVSCEKVIDVPLNEADQQIVVEAVGRSFVGESYVILSKTGTVYDDSGFEKLTGAVVTITDKDGIVTLFAEDPLNPGKYLSPTFQTVPLNQYSLKVNLTDGSELTSTSTTKSLATIDSLNFIQQNGGFGGVTTDTTFLVFYHFKDILGEENFYRVRAWVNGERDDNYYLGNDLLGDGVPTRAPLFATSVSSKDTVLVELLSMDEATYTYLTTLSSNVSQGAFSASPGNPVSNVNGAIGYFGTYSIDTMSIIMP